MGRGPGPRLRRGAGGREGVPLPAGAARLERAAVELRLLPELPPEDIVERGVYDDLVDLVAAELGSDSGATVRVRRGHPAEVVLEAAADAVALVVVAAVMAA